MDKLIKTGNTGLSRLEEVKQKTNDKTVILHFGSKKIRDYSENEFNGLIAKLPALVLLAGVSTPLDHKQSEILIDFWVHQFRDVSYSEVEAAIKKNSAWEFKEKVEHYQKFNNDFLGSIIHFYKLFRTERLAKYSNTVNPPLSMLDTTETDKVALLLMADLETFKELNEKFKKGMVLGFELMHSVRYFETLKRMGKLPEYKNPDKWKEINEEEFRNANSSDKLNGQLVKDSRSYNKALKRYKKYVLEVFLSGLKEMEIEDLNDL